LMIFLQTFSTWLKSRFWTVSVWRWPARSQNLDQ